jgi:hypothetical protein
MQKLLIGHLQARFISDVGYYGVLLDKLVKLAISNPVVRSFLRGSFHSRTTKRSLTRQTTDGLADHL